MNPQRSTIESQRRLGPEEALRESAARSTARLQAILNVLPAYTWYAAPSGALTFVNQRTADYLGLPKDHPLRFGIDNGALWDDWVPLLHPDDQEEPRKYWSNCLRTGEGGEHSYRVRSAQGNYRWFLTRFEPLRTSDGTLLLWIGATLDIEELKCAEEGLRESEYKLRQVIDTVPGLIWSTDPAGELTQINQWVLDYSGMRFEDFLHLGWHKIHHPDDLLETANAFHHAIQTGTSYRTLSRLRQADGEYRWHHVRAEPLRDREGRIVQWYGLSIDIDEAKKAEDRLRESEAKFRDYAETASDWFWETGPDYRFTLLTENAFGSDSADRLGTACWEHALDLETEPEKWRLVQATLDSRKPFRDFIYCTMGGDGSPMYVRASGKPVFDASGEFRGYRGTGADVTAVVRAQRTEASLRTVQAELAHVSRVATLGQLTASIAHEVTQPISSARNNARAALNFLNKEAPDLAEIREALACIVADSDRAGQIIDRIRDQTRKAPPRRDRFDLNGAVNEVIALLQGEIVHNRVSVQTRLADRQCLVEGDRVQLQQVVMNLILNAIEAMSSFEGGARELLISTEQNHTDGVLVAVRDSGPGIEPEHRERAFEPFYTTKSSGMGMGLSICRSIIDGHGGRLWGDAIEPSGTVFQFTVPTVERALMNSVPERHQSEGPHADTASAASRRGVSEDNRPRHLSRRVPVQHHLDSQ